MTITPAAGGKDRPERGDPPGAGTGGEPPHDDAKEAARTRKEKERLDREAGDVADDLADFA
jgi:hypothetical protein